MNRHAAITLVALLTAAGTARAGLTLENTGFVTADNHYAIYVRTGESIQLVGGNELGAAGDPGTYNWSFAEIHDLPAEFTDIYVATWSDNDSNHGWLGQFYLPTETIYTGDSRWRVYATGVDLNDNAPYPPAADIAMHAAFADEFNLWETPFVGPQNLETTPHWGEIGGIDEDARWMWRDTGSDPLHAGGDLGEYLIFHINPVPAPGPVALVGIAGLAMLRRRR